MTQADDEMVLFASLKGIVNAKEPRIFSFEGDAFAEGQYTWLQSLGWEHGAGEAVRRPLRSQPGRADVGVGQCFPDHVV